MIELSSLTASVTLGESVSCFSVHLLKYLHEGVGLLLLLEDGCCDLVVLWRVSVCDLSIMSSCTYALGLSA